MTKKHITMHILHIRHCETNFGGDITEICPRKDTYDLAKQISVVISRKFVQKRTHTTLRNKFLWVISHKFVQKKVIVLPKYGHDTTGNNENNQDAIYWQRTMDTNICGIKII
jgi:hypothetical protein